jgi:hypothetical protein
MQEPTLKRKNLPYLWSFFAANVAIFVSLFYATQMEKLTQNLQTEGLVRSIGICVAPVLLFVLNSLLSSQQKNILVFWRLKNVLPGHRAFSYYALRDPRIDIQNLNRRHPDIPTSFNDQNRLWYRIYISNNSNPVVVKSHKDFLLARDLTSMSFLFLVGVGLPCLLFIGHDVKWVYFLFLSIQFFLMAIVAQNHGKSFVRNVLAVDSVRIS